MLDPIAQHLLDTLPSAPSPDVSDKYMFIDTKKVIADMADLGYQVADFSRPKARTKAGHYGIHQVDFRKPENMARPNGEAPRVIFMNSYDGSKKAQIVSGVIRFICTNGLVAGDIHQNEKFLHLGDYEEQLLAHIKSSTQTADRVFGRIETFQTVSIDPHLALEMADRAGRLRFPVGDDPLPVKAKTLLQPRRREDMSDSLWMTWNRLQENLLKGGVPIMAEDGRVTLSRPLQQIQKAHDLNRDLWNLLEEYAEKV